MKWLVSFNLISFMALSIFLMPETAEASRLWGAVADQGYILNAGDTSLNSGNYFLIQNFQLNRFADQGRYHPSGWGLVWYTAAGSGAFPR